MKTLIKWRCIVSSPEPLVCINGPGHMIKMAAVLIYGEQPLKKSSSPEPADRFPRNLACSIGDSCPL